MKLKLLFIFSCVFKSLAELLKIETFAFFDMLAKDFLWVVVSRVELNVFFLFCFINLSRLSHLLIHLESR
jgi:hypothetical protein